MFNSRAGEKENVLENENEQKWGLFGQMEEAGLNCISVLDILGKTELRVTVKADCGLCQALQSQHLGGYRD